MAKTKALGKGLDALFQEKIDLSSDISSEKSTHSPYTTVDINKLVLNPNQPRKHISEQGIEELSISIKNQGLLQPILVRPSKKHQEKFEIIAGERRYRAAMKAGLTEVPVIVTELSDEEALVVALVENLQREDLNCLEEAEALKKIKELMNITQEELAYRVGKSRSHVANLLRILNLDDEIKEGLKEGIITLGHGRALLAIEDPKERIIAYNYAVKKGLSVRDVEKIAHFWNRHGTLPTYCYQKGKSSKNNDIDEEIEALNDIIKKHVPVNAKVKGTLDSGTITFKYKNQDQLKLLLKAFGIKIIKGDVSRETNER